MFSTVQLHCVSPCNAHVGVWKQPSNPVCYVQSRRLLAYPYQRGFAQRRQMLQESTGESEGGGSGMSAGCFPDIYDSQDFKNWLDGSYIGKCALFCCVYCCVYHGLMMAGVSFAACKGSVSGTRWPGSQIMLNSLCCCMQSLSLEATPSTPLASSFGLYMAWGFWQCHFSELGQCTTHRFLLFSCAVLSLWATENYQSLRQRPFCHCFCPCPYQTVYDRAAAI